VPFVSAVFNLDQADGIKAPADDLKPDPHRRLEVAELMLQVLADKPKILHTITSEPAYAPGPDRITMPHLSQFESADEYYSTFFHELVHATGHPRRLNRFAEAEGEKIEKYSFEELVAEFGSVFLCAFAGIKNPQSEALQASYIAGWSEVFRKDNRILLRAASAAQHAAYYIRGRETAVESAAVAA
jgi:antirestriction protein ArdC